MALQQGQNVELVSQIGGATYAVAVRGNYAYIGVGPRLVVLDVSNPASPTVIGRTGVLPGVVRGVAVSGSYAYVAAGSLRIIDVSSPASPREVSFYDTWDALGVAVSGSYAYVADGSGGLVILRFVGGGPTPIQVETKAPELSSEDPLHKVVLRGVVTATSSIRVWFEWGTDPNLGNYQITGTQTLAGEARVVTATLQLTDSIGVLYYYRVAGGDPANPNRGSVEPFLLVLGRPDQQTVTSKPFLNYWNKFDRLIRTYARQNNIPPTVMKAIVIHESSWCGNDAPSPFSSTSREPAGGLSATELRITSQEAYATHSSDLSPRARGCGGPLLLRLR